MIMNVDTCLLLMLQTSIVVALCMKNANINPINKEVST